jgi:hypothetical protein
VSPDSDFVEVDLDTSVSEYFDLEMDASQTDAMAANAVAAAHEKMLEDALSEYMWELDDSDIDLLDDYGPKCYGLEIPQRIIFEAYIIRGDVRRPRGSVHETGRNSEPAFQDMNMETLRTVKPGAPRPVVLLKSEKMEDIMDPSYLLMAYEEHGSVKPVVSDFDCFLAGTRRIEFEKPLPPDQVDMMK